MPSADRSRRDLEMHYEIDDFADPWTTPETVLLLHGNAESSAAWYAWVPLLGAAASGRAAGHARLRPVDADAASTTRGRSTRIIDDFLRLTDRSASSASISSRRRSAAPIALRLAAREPGARGIADRARLAGPGEARVGDRAAVARHIEQHGVESWARWTMPGRLGSDSRRR